MRALTFKGIFQTVVETFSQNAGASASQGLTKFNRTERLAFDNLRGLEGS